MTTLDKIKLIDFYLHGVDRDLWDFEIPIRIKLLKLKLENLNKGRND